MSAVATDSRQSLSARTADRRLWRSALVLLIILECAPFWIFPYFPSQDGPSHLHNASVLAHYGTTQIYQQYYRIVPFTPAGNMLTQFLLAAIVKVAEPFLAEKLLLSSYIILFFVSFLYLLRGLTPHADHFAVWAGIFAPNWFVYMGFWNFSFSVAFLLLTVGYYVRQVWGNHSERRWTPRQLIVLMSAGLIIYMTHAVSWVVCIIAVASLGFPKLMSTVLSRGTSSFVRSARRAAPYWLLPICALLLPVVLVVANAARSHEISVCSGQSFPFRDRLWLVYSLSFLHTLGGSDVALSKVVAMVVFMGLTWAAAVTLWHRQYNWHSAAILGLSLTCVIIAVAGPDCVGTGSFVRLRVALFAWLFLIGWLASALPKWPRWALNGLSGCCCGIALITLVSRVPMVAELNEGLSDIVKIGESVRPNSTVLVLCLGRQKRDVDPFRHLAGLLTPRAIVDLNNYEASLEYFSTRFQTDRSPYPALGTMRELEEAPPVFDITRYEKETAGRVDYVLFYCSNDSGGAGMKLLQSELYRRQIAGYALVRASHSRSVGDLRLYGRSPAGVGERTGAQ